MIAASVCRSATVATDPETRHRADAVRDVLKEFPEPKP